MNRRAPNPRREELRALSAAIRPLVKAGMYESVNAGLVAHYTAETGATEWHTFHDWKSAGRPVKKGETGFPIWGTPRRIENATGAVGDLAAVMVATGQVKPEDLAPEFFPVAYLFNEKQVQGAPDASQAPLFEASP